MPMIATTRRLSDKTCELARRALTGEWGQALADLPVTLNDDPKWDTLSSEMRYALGVFRIAEYAPVRFIPGLNVVGSASLRLAAQHVLPILREGKPAFFSTSHLTLGFDVALCIGYRGLRAQVEERMARGDLDDKGVELLQAMLVCLDAAALWHRRYLDHLQELAANAADENERTHIDAIIANLHEVPENPPATFAQAVQALWFLFAFQRLVGNWPGIGRIDEMLGGFLRRDLATGRITLDEARELLAHFWIAGCEWVGSENRFGGSGDAQFYQNIVLGGVDTDGNEITNEVTYLILDVVEELRISDFPIAVRISPQSPERLLRRIVEVQRLGGGIVAVYNEPLVLEALTRFGYPLREARRFANDGCWEVQIPGETCFDYRPFDTLALLQEVLGVTGEREPASFATFEELYAAYWERLGRMVEQIHGEADTFASGGTPSTCVSLLEKGCIENGRGYHDRGTRYVVYSPHAGGLPDTGNSLLAIRKLVYEEQRISLSELVRCLRVNWEGYEALRRQALQITAYGNDAPEADAMTRRVFDDFLAFAGSVRERNGVLRPPGVSTFGREIEWRPQRGATADGHRAGAILATNFSPSPGTDREGPTAVIASLCAMDLVRLPNGTALESKMLPGSVEGETGLNALVGLLKTFVQLGGFFMHIEVVSSELLREAQREPERYANLAVRVSGWSARFVTLDANWQEMIIHRTEQPVR